MLPHKEKSYRKSFRIKKKIVKMKLFQNMHLDHASSKGFLCLPWKIEN